ncbi:Secreted protein [Corynebacterium falsenii]|uniref:Uncharacterized protein n=2 Tax=Corynebacterium falsenii TaxID=108486 RepID=A0A418Q533_9CORY|nr:hypothetical protein D3M95_10180 [Corynebacterium falsenii]
MRRRIAAVVVIVLVILLIWWIVSALSGGDNNAATTANTASQSSTVSSSAKPSESKKADASASSSESESPSGSESATDTAKPSDPNAAGAEGAEGKDTCTVADLQVTATPGEPTFPAGQLPKFFATIKNPTKADCVVDFNTNQLKFEVFTMNNYERVWADTDCNAPEVTGDVTIPAGRSVNYELEAWSRTTSAPGKCDNRQPVSPGNYLLYAHVGDNTSQPATFNLG